jgi:hypothetical protein
MKRNYLLCLLGILIWAERAVSETIAKAVLTHPLVADGKGKLGSVVHREEFTRLLMDMASGGGVATLESDAKAKLEDMLKNSGITNPKQTLERVRHMAMQLEASHPELAYDVRQAKALIQVANSDYVARVNAWFDQTMDRVSQRFTQYTRWVTVGAALVVVLVVQLDIVAVVDRLSIDDQFRNTVVSAAAKDFSDKTAAKDVSDKTAVKSDTSSTTAADQTAVKPDTNTAAADQTAVKADTNTAAADKTAVKADPKSPASSGEGGAVPNVAPGPYYDLLSKTGLITLPTNRGWRKQLEDPRKYPGMVLAVLLISLGAPFWYNILKDLLGLRSQIAKSDDSQRTIRQTKQSVS